MRSAEKLVIIYSLFQGVLCREFSISLPENVEAVRRLCVLIPCRFEINEQFDGDLQKDPTGIWLKDGTDTNDNRVFNSKVTEENKIEGEIIGDLHMKNCTTIFYNIRQSDSGVYYFRIETSGSLIYTYRSPSVSVRVGDSPITPSITLYKEDQGEVEHQNEVVEGTSVSLICSAPAPPCLLKPPTFTWNFLPEERRQEQNHNTRFSSSQLNFRATHLHHGLTFTCTATYQLHNSNKSAQSSFILHVLYGPRNTSVSVSPSSSVLLGSSVSLRCSSDANPAVLIYTWYRENGEQIGTGNHLTINITDCTHSGLYYCRAQNQHGDHNSSVILEILYSPIRPSITLYKEDQGEVEDQNEVVEGTSVSLICSAPAPPCLLKPPTFTWNFLPQERRQEQNHNTTFSSSQLNFRATLLHHGLNFTCTATYQLQNRNKSAQNSFILHVLYGPRNTSVSASPSASVLLGSSVSLRCSSDANPAVLNYTWYRENGEQIGTGNHLTINTTDSTHSGLYYCRAQNQHGDHNSSVLLDVLYAPQLSPSSSCNTTQEVIRCFCEFHGNPSPKLEWRNSGQTVFPSDNISTWAESVSNNTLRSFISIGPPVNDTLTPQCVGTNKLGVTSQVFFSILNKAQCSHAGPDVDISSVLIGAAVGASVMMILCGVFLCVRKASPLQSGPGDSAGFDTVEDEEFVYSNKTVLSESLHYSTVVFPNGEGSEIRGLSKLTADYAVIRHSSKHLTEGGVPETAIEEVQEVMGTNMEQEEATYGNITRPSDDGAN